MVTKKGQGSRVKSKVRGTKKVHGSWFIVHSFRARLQLVFSIFLILLGAALIGYSASQNFEFSLKQETPQSGASQKQEKSQKPEYSRIKFINIPKISRNLVVEDGYFENGRWVVSDSGVSFYTNSSLPEAGGNTVLYGHNKAVILGGLVALKKGDKIVLTLESGKILAYEVSETKTIKPTEVDILNQTSEARLTIYTCSGFLDNARFVVLAKRV